MIVSEPVIRMENIIKRYYIGKPNELQILNGISLSVDQGEFVSIVGESGSGKSTLMNIIGVLDRQTEGTYFLEGKDVNKMDDSMRSAIRNKRIGFVFQNFNLLPKANALKNVMVPLLYSTEKEKNQKERAMEMLKMVGMEERAFHKPNELSGGQKKRLALASCLVSPADVLILDEPTNHLDTEMNDYLEDYLKKFKGALVMVTHDRYFLDAVTNSIAEIDKGSLYTYDTNYSGFLALKAEREDMAMAADRKRKSILRTELEWIQRGARARSTKQKARIDRYEQMKKFR